MPKKSVQSADPLVQEYMGIFADAYSDSSRDRSRMKEMQAMYDNLVDEASWPTTAKMSLPLMLSYVLQNLPHALEYLYPDRQWITCVPAEPEVDIEQARNTEYALQYMLMNRMRLKMTSFPTLRDSYKLGVGFGIVEPIMVTPMRSVENRLYNTDRTLARRTRRVMPAADKRSVRFRYINPGCIIVTKDGVRFNGDNRVSVAFFVDDIGEAQFRRMMKAENSPLSGNVEKIIAEAREMRLDAKVPIANVIEDLAGRKINSKAGSNKDFPVRVPVIKVYAVNRHLWIANGTTVIFDTGEQDFELRCPLQKADAGQDGDRFYPLSVAEACQKPWLGVNLYVSGLFDLLTQSLNPMLAYDKSKGGAAPERNSNGLIGTYGPIRDSIGYITPPGANQQVFTVGEMLLSMLADVTAKTSNMSPGMVRGGGFALADLMKSTYGQHAMGDAMLGTGFLLPTVEQTLIEMQEIVSAEGGDAFALREWNEESEEEYVKRMSITEDDIVHAYEIDLDLRQGNGSSAQAFSERVAKYDRLTKSPHVDQWENTAEFIGDYRQAKRLLFSRAKVRRQQEEQRIAALQQQAGPAAAPGGEAMAGAGMGGESTPTMEGMAGAEAATAGEAGGMGGL